MRGAKCMPDCSLFFSFLFVSFRSLFLSGALYVIPYVYIYSVCIIHVHITLDHTFSPCAQETCAFRHRVASYGCVPLCCLQLFIYQDAYPRYVACRCCPPPAHANRGYTRPWSSHSYSPHSSLLNQHNVLSFPPPSTFSPPSPAAAASSSSSSSSSGSPFFPSPSPLCYLLRALQSGVPQWLLPQSLLLRRCLRLLSFCVPAPRACMLAHAFACRSASSATTRAPHSLSPYRLMLLRALHSSSRSRARRVPLSRSPPPILSGSSLLGLALPSTVYARVASLLEVVVRLNDPRADLARLDLCWSLTPSLPFRRQILSSSLISVGIYFRPQRFNPCLSYAPNQALTHLSLSLMDFRNINDPPAPSNIYVAIAPRSTPVEKM